MFIYINYIYSVFVYNVNNSFKIIENNQTFYIQETSTSINSSLFSKISKINENYESTIAALEKIEQVIKKIRNNELSYDKTKSQDSEWNDKEILIKKLKAKAIEIDQSYRTTTSKLNWLIRLIFNISKRQKIVHQTQEKIEYYENSQIILPPCKDMIQEVAQYLPMSAVAAIARVNRQGHIQAGQIKIERARELGYEGSDPQEANLYLSQLMNEIKEIKIRIKDLYFDRSSEGSFLKKVGGATASEILKSLHSLNKEEIFEFFANTKYFVHSRLPSLTQCFIHLAKKMKSENETKLAMLSNKALSSAVSCNQIDLVKLLFAHGAKFDDVDILRWIAHCQYLDMLKLLVSHGVNIDAQNIRYGMNFNVQKYGGTALMSACDVMSFNFERGLRINPDVIEFLLQKGANPNLIDDYGRTALHYAIRSGDAKAVELLLAAGANVNQLTQKGQSPLAFACGAGVDQDEHFDLNLEIISLLLKHGANVNLCDKKGRFPLDYVKKRSDPLNIAQLLILKGAKRAQNSIFSRFF